jgi:N-dimethylarginine dimethylaminohydrolase
MGDGTAGGLGWGWRYLMVAPDHFRVDYEINPFMHLSEQPDAVAARVEWNAVGDAITAAGGQVEVLTQRADAPDMVYAMNLGLALQGPENPEVVLSHMRFPQRRMEIETARAWFAEQGALIRQIGAHGVGAHFEAGDAFAWRGDLVVGYGPRTDRLALKHLATDLDVRVHGLHTVHAGMYHLDLAFCPLDSERALVCPSAFDENSAARLLDLVPEPLVLSETEAMTFCANSVVVGRTVVMPACPDRVRSRLEAWGFEIVVVAVPEFIKGGGAIRCLTNPLDVALGRDLVTGRGQVLAGHHS